MQSQAAFSFLHIFSALGVAVVWIAAFSFLREPARHKLSAIMIAGAGAAYLSGGLGAWEFLGCAAFTARRIEDMRPRIPQRARVGLCRAGLLRGRPPKFPFRYQLSRVAAP